MLLDLSKSAARSLLHPELDEQYQRQDISASRQIDDKQTTIQVQSRARELLHPQIESVPEKATSGGFIDQVKQRGQGILNKANAIAPLFDNASIVRQKSQPSSVIADVDPYTGQAGFAQLPDQPSVPRRPILDMPSAPSPAPERPQVPEDFINKLPPEAQLAYRDQKMPSWEDFVNMMNHWSQSPTGQAILRPSDAGASFLTGQPRTMKPASNLGEKVLDAAGYVGSMFVNLPGVGVSTVGLTQPAARSARTVVGAKVTPKLADAAARFPNPTLAYAGRKAAEILPAVASGAVRGTQYEAMNQFRSGEEMTPEERAKRIAAASVIGGGVEAAFEVIAPHVLNALHNAKQKGTTAIQVQWNKLTGQKSLTPQYIKSTMRPVTGKGASDFIKDGYQEYRPGLWVKYDPNTGQMIGQAYEAVNYVQGGKQVTDLKYHLFKKGLLQDVQPVRFSPAAQTTPPTAAATQPVAQRAQGVSGVSATILPGVSPVTPVVDATNAAAAIGSMPQQPPIVPPQAAQQPSVPELTQTGQTNVLGIDVSPQQETGLKTDSSTPAGVNKPVNIHGKPVVEGALSKVKTARGTEASIRYALVEADDVVASHDTTMRPSEQYPQELQPRDRRRAASEMQVNNILASLEPEFLGESPKASEGRMLVDRNLNVVSGNGRVIALKRGYDQNHANIEKYRQWLLSSAEKFGIDPVAVQSAQKPVLVGLLQGDEVDLTKFAHEANESSVAAMSATEQAVADSGKLTGEIMEIFRPGENGEITSASNRDFIRSFIGEVVGPTEQGRYMMKDGSLSQEGITRIRNAVFARAYDDVAILERLAESPDNNIRNITNAMLKAAPRFAAIKDSIEKGESFNLDITPEIGEVAKQLSALRDFGMKVEDYLQQQVLFEEAAMSPLARDLLEVFHKNSRSTKKLATILDMYADAVELAGDPRQKSFFAEKQPTKAEALEAVIRRFERGGYETSIFGDQAERSAGVGTETGAKAEVRQTEPGGTISVASIDDAQRIIASRDSYNKITVNADAKIPRYIMEQLREVVKGWNIQKHDDGSATFSRLAHVRENEGGYDNKLIHKSVEKAYGRLEIREGEAKEPAINLASQAISGLSNISNVQTLSGKQDESGVRTLALAIRRDLIQDGRVSFEGQVVKNDNDLAVLAHVLRDPRFETLRFFYVDGQGKILAQEAHTSRLPALVRSFSTNLTRDIYKIKNRMDRLGAAGFYMLHNHPSGSTAPSADDVRMTRHVAQWLPGFKGHLIIDHDEFTTIDAQGGLVKKTFAGGPPANNDIMTPEVDHPVLSAISGISNPQDVAQIARAIKSRDGFVTILYRASNGQVRAIQEVPLGLYLQGIEMGDYLRGRAREFGAGSRFAYYDTDALNSGGSGTEFISASRYLVQEGYLTDVVTGTATTPVSASLRRQIGAPFGRELGIDTSKSENIPRIRVREDALSDYDNELVGVEFLLEGMEKNTSARQSEAKDAKSQAFSGQGPKLKTNQQADQESIPLTKRRDIVKFLEKELDVPTRIGRFTGRALGIFKVKPEVIRTRVANDLPVLSHEIGHYLDKKLQLSDSTYDNELLQVGKQTSRPSYTKQQVRKEGVAEFMRLYLTSPSQAQKRAPKYYAAFEAKMTANPEVHNVLLQARQDIYNWMNQTPEARILASMSIGEKRKTRPMTLDRLYTMAVDELRPIKKYVEAIAGKGVDIEKDPFQQAWLARGWVGKAETYLHYGVVDKSFNKIGPSLEEILKPVGDNLDDFRVYIASTRAVELHSRGIDAGLGEGYQDVSVAAKRQETPEFKSALKELVSFQDAVLQELVKFGVVSKKGAQAMRELNQNYVPLYRVFEEWGTHGFGQGSGYANLNSPINRIKGSKRDAIDPLESIIKNTYFMINVAERNKVGRLIVELAQEKDGAGKWVEEVATPMHGTQFNLGEIKDVLEEVGINTAEIDMDQVASIFRPSHFPPGKENILTVFENGQRRYFQLEPELYRATLALDKEIIPAYIKLLSLPAKTLRAGATLAPEFLARNPVRDVMTALVFSKYKFTPADFARGLYHAVKKDDMYWKFHAAGGAHGAWVSLDRDYLHGSLRNLLTRSAKDKTVGYAKNPLEILRALGEFGEAATRLGEFGKGVKKEGANRAGIMKAALAARDVTLDFSRMGTAVKIPNRITPFFNAAIQGGDKLVRTAKERPGQLLMNSLLYITIPAIALYLVNRDDERYQELPQWEKDSYFIIPTKDALIRIPKPFELGMMFGTFAERTLAQINHDDKDALDGFAAEFFEGLVPSIVPTAFLGWWEVSSNYNRFTDRPIVPRSEESLAPELQYGDYTSETAKLLGRTLNFSPRKADHLIRAYGGGLARHGTKIIDQVIKALDKEERPAKPAATAADYPLIGAFVSRVYSSSNSIDKFYTELNEAEMAKNSADKRGSATPEEKEKLKYLSKYRSIAGYLSDIRRESQNITASKTLSADEKRERLDILNIVQINMARRALGKELITILPDDQND